MTRYLVLGWKTPSRRLCLFRTLDNIGYIAAGSGAKTMTPSLRRITLDPR